MHETLREAGHATVIVEEQVAARMYTGPMYMKYNLVLRGMGAGRHTKIHEEYERVCKLNTRALGPRSNIVQAAHGPRLLLPRPSSRYSSGTRRRCT